MPSSAYIGRNGQLTKICPCNKSVIPITWSCPCAQKNSPVLLDSGLVSFTIPLLSAAAVGAGGFSFNLEYYSDPSTTSSDGTVGYGFNYSQNVLLTPSGDNVLLQLGENTQELFVNVGGGVYSSANNNTAATLAPATGGGFTITTRGGTVSNWTGFDSPTPGRMTQLADRFGNTQTFNWGIVGCSAVRLLDLTDSYQRPITLAYWGPEFNYALRTVRDFTGRQVDLQYSGGLLTAIVGPAVTRGANNNSNVFPGLGQAFKYDITNPRQDRQRDLIAIYQPNQVAPYLDSTRTVDVAAVYANALAREQLAYHQDPTDTDQWGKVQQYTESATGTGSIGAGEYGYMYVATGLPTNLANPADPIVSRTIVTDRMGNQTAHDIGASGMIAHTEVFATRMKNSLQATSYETWLAWNTHNQNTLTVYPERNCVVRTYEDETTVPVINGAPYAPRIGIPRTVTKLPGNPIGLLPVHGGSNGQTQLVQTMFSDPLFGRETASIEARGNPIDLSGDFFIPQNGGVTPTDADKTRYATITYFDYQKDIETTTGGVPGVANDTALQAQLGLTHDQIVTLIGYVNDQMQATDGTGGIPAGFVLGLGDINGEGTGNGAASGLPAATHIGNVVKKLLPPALQIGPSAQPYAGQAYPQTIKLDGAAAYYRFGDAVGSSTAAEYINGGGAYVGSYAATGVVLAQPGAARGDPNTAVYFNGASGGDSFTAGSALLDYTDTPSSLSLEAWLKINVADGVQTSAQYVGWVGTFELISDPATGNLQLDYGSGTPIDSGMSLVDGQWHHLAGIYDSVAGTATLFVDGAVVGTPAATGPLPTGAGNLVANDNGGNNAYFLDELAVYRQVLTPARVRAHYFAGLGRFELFTSNLLGQNTTRTDAEGNVTVTVRYAQNDPEGAAQYLVPSLSNKQYGFVKETRVDVDPATVMTLLGPDADMIAFTGGIITRLNTPGVYQNLVTKYRPSGTGSGCSGCAYDPLGNPLAVTDARGHTTTYERNELGEAYRKTSPAPYNFPVETYFDSNRNVIRVDRQDFVVKYATNDPSAPAYARFIPTGEAVSPAAASASPPPPGLSCTANLPMMPGPGGSVRPGWFSNLYSFDLLDNPIEDDIDATGSSPGSLVTTRAFDFNQNLVKLAKPLGNTIEYDWDERNLKIATRVGGPGGSVTIVARDGNGNITDVIGPATRGSPAQTLSAVIADAFGGGSSITFSGDWLVEKFHDGFDRDISTVDAAGGMVLKVFDPGGRAIGTMVYGSPGGPTPTDRTGATNVLLASSQARFDEGGRQYEAQKDVFLGGAYYPSFPGALPSGRTVTHTGGGLAINSTASDHTGTVVLTAGGTSYVLTRTIFDRADRGIGMAADNTGVTTISLDGAGRKIVAEDPLGNIVQATPDGNGNVIFTTRLEKCTISDTIAPESFSSAAAFDVLNQKIVQMDQGPDGSLNTNWVTCCTWPVLPPTLFTFLGFDSRGNRTNLIDPKQNTTAWEFDGASRELRQKRHLRPSGDGTTAINATVLTQTAYDANSNTIRLVDDNGGVTAWLYDLLDRNTVMTFHDGSMRTNAFNAASDVIGYTDENGSFFANTWDVLSRKVNVDITPALGVAGNAALSSIPGTLFQTAEFDGLSRPTFARDSVGVFGGGGLTNADVGFTRDSIDRVLEEQQTYDGDTRYVTHNAWTSYPSTGFTFPNARQLTVGFDALYRKNAINEVTGGGSIASWQFFGGRTATVTLGNGIVTSFMNNAQTRSAIQQGQTTPAWGDIGTDHLGYDGSARPIAKRHFNGAPVLVGFTTAFDPSGNKLFERALHGDESRSSLYATDSMDRLLQYQRGILASGGLSIATPISLVNTDSLRNYALDGLGNWSNTSFTLITETGPAAELDVRTHNKLNQITAFDAPSAPTPILYDQGNNAGSPPQKGNGNIIDDGLRLNVFDALDRLVSVKRKSDGGAVGAYVYDLLGRRFLRQILGAISGTIPTSTSRYLLDGQQIVEELSGATGTTRIQYVWGRYVDELIQLKALTTIGPQSLVADSYYLLSDLLYRSAALTKTTGGVAIVEAYDTGAYGNTLLFSGPDTDGNWFTNNAALAAYSACRYVLTGREFDPETGNYFYRARYYGPPLARFVSRDGMLYAGGSNIYQYARSAPVRSVDPGGTLSWDFDETACTVTMTFRIRLYWTWRNWGTLLGTDDKLDQLRKVFKSYVEKEFNTGHFKIYPSGKTIAAYGIGGCFWHPSRACPCQGGWTPKLNLVTDAGILNFDSEAAVIYQDHSTDYPGERSSADTHDIAPGHNADIYENDFYPASNSPGAQVHAVHEFGHLLGLEHPGHDGITLPAPLPKIQWNTIPDYMADGPALMGAGMQLRWFYFQRWADKLAAQYRDCAPFTIR